MEKNKNGKFIWGIILVCTGCFLILGNLGMIPSFGRLIGLFWPLILIFMSLMFHFGYYTNRKNVGLLVPGGVLFTVGIVCQVSMLWNLWGYLWPGFVLAPAVGLFELYIFGNRDKGLLVPVTILSGLSLIFFTRNFLAFGAFAKYLIPITLIIIGAVILSRNKTQQEQYYAKNSQQGNYENNNHV